MPAESYVPLGSRDSYVRVLAVPVRSGERCEWPPLSVCKGIAIASVVREEMHPAQDARLRTRQPSAPPHEGESQLPKEWMVRRQCSMGPCGRRESNASLL